MKRKVLAILMAAAMTMTVMAGCGGAAPSETKDPGAQPQTGADAASGEKTGQEEKTTFKIAVVLHPLTKDEDFNNKEIYKKAEEATGVHIEWIPIASSDAEDKVNIMLASDLPDAFLGLIGENQIANNMDSFADLAADDVLKNYAPHVYSDYETIPGGLDPGNLARRLHPFSHDRQTDQL